MEVQTRNDGSIVAEPPINSACVSSSLGRLAPIFSSFAGAWRQRPFLQLAPDGGDEETRTPDPLLAKEMLCQLSYVPRRRVVVGDTGLEPVTSALSGQRSNQLS